MSEYQKFNVNEQKSAASTSSYKPKEPIDAGIYEGEITGLAWRDNNKKTGKYLLVSITVLNENLVFPETRVINHYLNLQNQNDFARSKATEEFTSLLSAIGIEDLDYHPEKGPAPHEYKRIIFSRLKVRVIIKDNQNSQRVNAIEGFYGVDEAVLSQKVEFSDPGEPPIEKNPPPAAKPSDYSDLNDDIPF